MKGQGRESGLPHAIHGLTEADRSLGLWIAVVVFAVIGLILAGLAMRAWWIRRQAPREQMAPEPWDVLLMNLEGLSVPQGVPARELENFYHGLSLGLRQAVEWRTGIPATDLTFAELEEPLRRRLPMGRDEGEKLIEFLRTADRVQFAGDHTGAGEAAGHKNHVVAWVKALRPREIDKVPLGQTIGDTTG